MAGIYDTILRGDPLEASRQQAKMRLQEQERAQQAQFLRSLEGLSPGVRQGAVAGQAAGQLFGGALSQALGLKTGPSSDERVEQSPEVAAARQNAALVKSLQGLSADPATAEWATQAAAQAKAAGREDLAFQLLGEAAQRRKAEAKLAQDAERKAREERRATLNTLPTAQRLSLIVNDPEAAASTYDLTGKKLEAFVQDARDTLDTMRAKNMAELSKVKPVSPANVTKGDLSAVDSTLATLGYDADAFNPGFGKDEEARGQFISIIADQARTEQELRARRGGETLPLDQITAEILQDLEASEVFIKSPERFGGGFTLSDDFNADKVRSLFKTRVDEFQGSKPVAPAATRARTEAAPSGPEVPFADFTQPAR